MLFLTFCVTPRIIRSSKKHKNTGAMVVLFYLCRIDSRNATMKNNGGKRRRSHPVIEQVQIIDVASEGKSIGKVNDMVVFVPDTIPGDIVDVQLTRRQKNFAEGYALRFHKYSEKRISPFCSHFGVCGGCKWQMMDYSDQLKYKQKQVEDNLRHLGKIVSCPINPILASPQTEYYRNKLEYTFSDTRWLTPDEMGTEPHEMRALGFHVSGKFDKIVNIEHCFLQASLSNEIRLAVRDFAIKENLSFYNLKRNQGFLRNLIVRNTTTDELMVVVVFGYNDDTLRIRLLNYIAHRFPDITSLMYVINGKQNDTISDLPVHLFQGRDHIFEQFDELRFKIGPKSFFQTNSRQAHTMYKHVRELARLTGHETVYDLYTGTGTIALFLARHAAKVVGVEAVEDAIKDARLNAKINQINNTEFYVGDMKDVFTPFFINEKGAPDVVVIDPPRAGLHPNVVKSLLLAEPARIVYISCNPATQARDLGLLNEKYKTETVQPIDMFPHTQHVENIATLARRY